MQKDPLVSLLLLIFYISLLSAIGCQSGILDFNTLADPRFEGQYSFEWACGEGHNQSCSLFMTVVHNCDTHTGDDGSVWFENGEITFIMTRSATASEYPWERLVFTSNEIRSRGLAVGDLLVQFPQFEGEARRPPSETVEGRLRLLPFDEALECPPQIRLASTEEGYNFTLNRLNECRE